MKLMIQNISKSYGKNLALDNISLELDCGIYALLGPNGSGKTTLMNIITGNVRSDQGDILYCENGDPESIFKMRTRFCEKLGYMPQYPGFYPHFTVEQFLQYVATLKNIGRNMSHKEKKNYINDQISNLLVAVELEDVRNNRISTLSGGMKQRLGLIQAVLGDPKILILDEPTAGLDPKQRISVRNFISKIALSKIVIFATHVVSDVEFIAKEVILLKKGHVVDTASPEELIHKIGNLVWEISCKSDLVEKMQKQYCVVNIAPKDSEEDSVVLRILSSNRPTESAKKAIPTLEDYYLYTFNQSTQNNKIL